ncbi:hypothetical protein JKP88DRAFT_221371 [Tribonema minus]|uniref:Uncharacterized protein n=1 Tax=Tribonema minus TaxID=303371 RepID=A0A836CE28_9STRA|nr:hypothetical protein JKP88DRAFT_221371 [Tribonema minus]
MVLLQTLAAALAASLLGAPHGAKVLVVAGRCSLVRRLRCLLHPGRRLPLPLPGAAARILRRRRRCCCRAARGGAACAASFNSERTANFTFGWSPCAARAVGTAFAASFSPKWTANTFGVEWAANFNFKLALGFGFGGHWRQRQRCWYVRFRCGRRGLRLKGGLHVRGAICAHVDAFDAADGCIPHLFRQLRHACHSLVGPVSAWHVLNLLPTHTAGPQAVELGKRGLEVVGAEALMPPSPQKKLGHALLLQ